MKVKCQDCGNTIEPNKGIESVPKNVYLDNSKSIAFEVSSKFKSASDLSQTLLKSQNQQTKRREDQISEFILSGENNTHSF